MNTIHDDEDLLAQMFASPPSNAELAALRITWATSVAIGGRIDKWDLTRSRIRRAAEAATTAAEFVELLVSALRRVDAHVTNAIAIELLAAAQAEDVLRTLRAEGEIAVLRCRVAIQSIKSTKAALATEELESF